MKLQPNLWLCTVYISAVILLTCCAVLGVGFTYIDCRVSYWGLLKCDTNVSFIVYINYHTSYVHTYTYTDNYPYVCTNQILLMIKYPLSMILDIIMVVTREHAYLSCLSIYAISNIHMQISHYFAISQCVYIFCSIVMQKKCRIS
jgi:hypothetical protein